VMDHRNKLMLTQLKRLGELKQRLAEIHRALAAQAKNTNNVTVS